MIMHSLPAGEFLQSKYNVERDHLVGSAKF